MNSIYKTCTLLFTVFVCSYSGTAKEWRGIDPLHSTRVDVDHLIGPKVVRCGSSACLYDLGEETVFVLYAAEPTCKNDDTTTRWKVPAGTVLEISVHFKKEKGLSELQLDLSKFEKVYDQHLPGWIYYTNFSDGIRVAGGLETASSITYFQQSKDNYLRCPSTKNPTTRARRLTRSPSRMVNRAMRLRAQSLFGVNYSPGTDLTPPYGIHSASLDYSPSNTRYLH
jgi:hypothetical protein